MIDKRFKKVDFESLLARLTTVASGWFHDKGCSNSEAVLPNTGKSAKDLAYDAVLEVLTKPELWRPKTPDEDPFPLIVTIMKHRFIDIVSRRKEYQRTVIVDAEIGTQNLVSTDGLSQVETKIYVEELYDLVREDPELKEHLEDVHILELREVQEIAEEHNISSQEVKKRQRKMRIKVAFPKPVSKGATSKKG